MVLSENRYNWADIAKGLGIFLMVWGHTSIPSALHDWIYSFHMPFFFILSGFFFKSGKYSFSQFLHRKIRTLLVPYIFFVAVIELLRWGAASLGLDVPKPRDVSDIVLLGKDMGATWFLMSLFLTEIAYFFIDKIGKRLWTIFAITALIFIFSYYCYLQELHFPYKLEIIGATLFYYFCGNVIAISKANEFVVDNKSKAWGGLFLLLLLIVDFIFANMFSPVLNLRLNRLGVHIPTLMLIALGSYVLIQFSHLIDGYGHHKIIALSKRFFLFIGEYSIVLIGFSQITTQCLKPLIAILNLPSIIAVTIRYTMVWLILLALIYIFKNYLPILIGKQQKRY